MISFETFHQTVDQTQENIILNVFSAILHLLEYWECRSSIFFSCISKWFLFSWVWYKKMIECVTDRVNCDCRKQCDT